MMWDERYSAPNYIYGTEPNEFLLDHVTTMKEEDMFPSRGTCLMLADGEGRNGVFMAQQGLQVTSVDISAVGLEKTQKLAKERQVSITTVQADLGDFDFGVGQWDMIVGISCHFPPPVREKVLAAIPKALRSGGTVVFECYTPKQLEYKTGGPSDPDWLYTPEIFKMAFGESLEIEWNEELVRHVVEGTYHSGEASVVQLVARKVTDD
jgi:SAM-dependent methyltransferase